MNKVRMALVGTSHPHSALYQELLANMEAVEVAAICHDGGTVIEPFARVPVYESVEELLAAARFDAALVTVLNNRAVAAILPLVAAGKHVLADKPVCRSAGEMRAIVDAVERYGVTFAVGYQNRFQPAHERARLLARSGQLGPIFAVQGHLFTTDVRSRGANHDLFRRAVSGGGILHWLGCHVLDLMLDLVESEPVAVCGQISTLSGTGIDVEDVGGLTVRFANGVIGTLLAGYTIPFETDSPYATSPKESALTVWAGRGHLTYEPLGSRYWETWYGVRDDVLGRSFNEYQLPPFPGYTGWLGKRLVEDFLAAIAEGRPPRAGARENLKVLEILDAVYRVREEGAC